MPAVNMIKATIRINIGNLLLNSAWTQPSVVTVIRAHALYNKHLFDSYDRLKERVTKLHTMNIAFILLIDNICTVRKHDSGYECNIARRNS